MTEGLEAVKEVNEFLKCPTCGRKRADLVITDVPKETLETFKDFANSDKFKSPNKDYGSYGFALKHLMDFFISCNQMNIDEINGKLDYVLEQIAKKDNAPEKEIRLLNGKTIRR